MRVEKITTDSLHYQNFNKVGGDEIITIPMSNYLNYTDCILSLEFSEYFIEKIISAITLYLVTGTEDRETIEELEEKINKSNITYPIFFRFDHYSCKDSKYFRDISEVNDSKTIAKIICTSKRSILSLKKSPYLFIFKYDEKIKDGFEIRTFIYNKRLIAISGYDSNKLLDFEVNWNSVIDQINSQIKELEKFNHYVADFVVYKDGNIKFLELNGYGRNSRTGPCFFSWNWIEERLISEEVIIRIRGD